MLRKDMIKLKDNSKKDNSKQNKIIVMIPAYNEELTISKVIKEIPRKINNHIVEILVMDDGSKDKTVEESKSAGADYVFSNKINRGLGVNFRNGLNHALKLNPDIIVNIDGDGQFNPKDIEKLTLPIIKKEADMVTATRFLKPELTKNMPFIKKWGNKRFTNLVNRITGQKFTDTQCGFRAYSREAALKLNLFGQFTYTQEVFIDLVNKGMKIKEIPVEVKYFKERDSHVSGNLRKYGLRSLGIIIRATRDAQPLTFFGVPALLVFILGFFGGLVSFVYWFIYHATTPIRTLFNVSVFFMIAGISLAILALVADMFKTLKMNQEQIIYMLKRQELGEKRE